jgi:hypothetical protein
MGLTGMALKLNRSWAHLLEQGLSLPLRDVPMTERQFITSRVDEPDGISDFLFSTINIMKIHRRNFFPFS